MRPRPLNDVFLPVRRIDKEKSHTDPVIWHLRREPEQVFDPFKILLHTPRTETEREIIHLNRDVEPSGGIENQIGRAYFIGPDGLVIVEEEDGYPACIEQFFNLRRRVFTPFSESRFAVLAYPMCLIHQNQIKPVLIAQVHVVDEQPSGTLELGSEGGRKRFPACRMSGRKLIPNSIRKELSGDYALACARTAFHHNGVMIVFLVVFL